jgi:hypothetical protein
LAPSRKEGKGCGKRKKKGAGTQHAQALGGRGRAANARMKKSLAPRRVFCERERLGLWAGPRQREAMVLCVLCVCVACASAARGRKVEVCVGVGRKGGGTEAGVGF